MYRGVKKLTYKYEFLKLELEEVEELLDEYTLIWAKYFGKYFVDKNAEMWMNEETGELRRDKPDEDEEDDPIPPPKPEKLKKLYRKLSTYAHPDKGGNIEEFNAIKKSYEEENLLELIKYAGLYNVAIELEKEDEILVEKSCSTLQKKIEVSKNTMAWAFGTGNREKKLALIKSIEKDLNITIDIEKLPKSLFES